MKRILSFVSIALLPIFTLSAQTDFSYREWSDGALNAEDFTRRRSAGNLIGQVYTGI